jgi:hypothetical protein
MQIKQRAAILAAGLLGIAGLGTGVAMAQSTTTPAPPAASATTPDNTEVQGTEVAGVEEPGDANLPGGGHADAPGQNVDHQFEGVE